MPDRCCCDVKIKDRSERKVLMALLAINALMFLVEITVGIIGDSTALIADSLDMLADAAVYGVGLYAVGKQALAKIRAAHISGLLQVMLGAGVAIDVVRRMIWGSEPKSFIMITIGCMALVANVICLQIIARHREGEVHMRASWIFLKNDVIANLGVILGGWLVYLIGSRFPDLIIGLAIAIIVTRGGILIMKDAANEKMAQYRRVP
ncbi:MAG: cation transporter [Desulfobacteraceae bacterium]|nr:cation transporter [Desulfobacteraceae bacterium]